MFRADEKIIEAVQAAYLWLYDWTGVYVATACTICVILGRTIAGFHTDAVSLEIMAFNIVVLIPSYNLQEKKQYTAYNAAALQLRTFKLRYFLTGALVGIFIAELARYDFYDACNTFLLIIYVYLSSVCIRDREPKEWFKQHHLAWNRTS